VTAVNAGRFGVYVSVLSQDPGDRPAPNTPAIDLRVTKRRTLNSGAILPLAIAVPALLGASRSCWCCAGAPGRLRRPFRARLARADPVVPPTVSSK
jgi:hypothetical protein